MKLSTCLQTYLDARALMSARLGGGNLLQSRWLSTCLLSAGGASPTGTALPTASGLAPQQSPSATAPGPGSTTGIAGPAGPVSAGQPATSSTGCTDLPPPGSSYTCAQQVCAVCASNAPYQSKCSGTLKQVFVVPILRRLSVNGDSTWSSALSQFATFIFRAGIFWAMQCRLHGQHRIPCWWLLPDNMWALPRGASSACGRPSIKHSWHKPLSLRCAILTT